MSPLTGLQLLAIAVLVALSAFFSGSEAAFFSLKPWQLSASPKANLRDVLVRRLVENPSRLLMTLLLGNECVNVTLSFLSSDLRARLMPGLYGALLGVAGTTAIVVLLGEAIPKAVSARYPLSVARTYSPLLALVERLVALPSRALLALVSLAPLPAPGVHDPVDELRHLISAARTEGSFHEDEDRLLGRLLELQRAPASSLMVPRTALCFLPADGDRRAILAAVESGREEWLPMRGRSADDTLGVVWRGDLAAWLLLDSPPDLASLARPVPFLPETRPLREIFLDLYRDGHPAVALGDEYGGLAGLITRETLAAYLLLPSSAPAAGSGLRFPGSLPYAAFRDSHLHAPPDPRCRTLAGHVLNLAGRVPSPGESVEDGAYRYTVIAATPRQVLFVEVTPIGAAGS
jgi:CBS domain containing-hemolysin-like protein